MGGGGGGGAGMLCVSARFANKCKQIQIKFTVSHTMYMHHGHIHVLSVNNIYQAWGSYVFYVYSYYYYNPVAPVYCKTKVARERIKCSVLVSNFTFHSNTLALASTRMGESLMAERLGQ